MLPEAYIAAMQKLLQEEYPAYEDALRQEALQGLRVNEGKITTEEFSRRTGPERDRIPWIYNGFYMNTQNGEDAVPAARHPYYYAGLYYLQEPSAMTPAAFLPVEPGDRVLDLCAAPGGKATELGARLGGRGLLLANDISASRAAVLLKNLERSGVRNFSVTAEDPARLVPHYPAYFDKILLDVPCSGEGMFRKDPSMRKYWPQRQPETYVEVQAALLEQAYQMLSPGGRMLYSTCTFSVQENEEQILAFLRRHSDCCMERLPEYQGFVRGRCGLPEAIRIYPHRMKGEGHFAALIRKAAASADEKTGPFSVSGKSFEDAACRERNGGGRERQVLSAGEYEAPAAKEKSSYAEKQESVRNSKKAGAFPEKGGLSKEGSSKGKKQKKSERSAESRKNGRGRQRGRMEEREDPANRLQEIRWAELPGEVRDFLGDCGGAFREGIFHLEKDYLTYYEGEQLWRPGIRFLRCGLLIGRLKDGRFQPSQAFAMTLQPGQYAHCADFQAEDPDVIRYLKGESIDAVHDGSPWQLVCVDGFPLGWAKASGNRLKNKYTPAWRWQ